MAASPLYGKKQSKISGTCGADFHETWYVALGTPAHHSYSNYDPGVTLTYFTARSNMVTWAFLWEKVKTVDFSETIAASDLKGSRRRHLIKYNYEDMYHAHI